MKKSIFTILAVLVLCTVLCISTKAEAATVAGGTFGSEHC